MNQREQIINHLQHHDTITFKEAFERYGISNLKGRIFELRQEGYQIYGQNVAFTTRLGKKSHYVAYRLIAKASA